MPYSTPPGPRIAYDIDGTVVLVSRQGSSYSAVEVPPNAVSALNAERGLSTVIRRGSSTTDTDVEWAGTLDTEKSWIGFIFPVPMDIDGVFANFLQAEYYASFPRYFHVSVSKDTTNGIDGTWVSVGTDLWSVRDPEAGSVNSASQDVVSTPSIYLGTGEPVSGFYSLAVDDNHRRVFSEEGVGIRTLSSSLTRGVKAVRVHYKDESSTSYDLSTNIQLFGSPENTGSFTRVAFWSTDTDTEAPTGWFDWGNTPLGSSDSKTFRIKNLSADKTAQGVILRAVAGVSDATPASSTTLLFSLDGAAWSASVTVSSLSPQAVSEVVYVRRTTPTTHSLGTFAPRLTADVGSWV